MSHPRKVARIAAARAPASRHADSGPAGNRAAAARAARSAAACARWRASTAAPTQTPPRLTVINTATRMAARTVAAPRSSPTRFGGCDGFSDDDDAGQHRRAAADPGDDVGAVAVQFQRGTGRGQCTRRDGAGAVTAGSKPGGLPGGVGAAHLHGDRGEAGEAEQQRGSETRNGQRGLDRAEAVIVGA